VADPYIFAQTLDDLMRSVFDAILQRGQPIRPSRGPARELTGILLELGDPRARLSRSETRGKVFSSLGELCWYLAKSDLLEFIAYYISDYKQNADGNQLLGAYGPRLFEWKGGDQLGTVTALLKRRLDSRQAVIQLFDASDILAAHKDIPCTCTLQFMLRGDRLHLFTHMRSNDVFLGLPHDVFSFTMIHEIVARELGVEVGSYKHAVGSLHLYDTNEIAARQFLGEGFQATVPMPPMPFGDPWPAINSLRGAEASIRTTGTVDEKSFDALDPYWADLIRLLQVFRSSKDGNTGDIEGLRSRMSSDVYRPFIDNRLSQL
jgi:thymidylate synthase